jgi:ATP-binding cassette subfamily B protein
LNQALTLKPYRAGLIFGGSCVFVTNLFKLIAPNVVGNAIDALKKEGTTQQTMLRYGLMLLAVALTQGTFLFIQRRVLINMSRHIEYDLRNDFYAHLQKLPFQFYQTQRTGDLMARATNDLSAVRMVVGPALMYSMNTLFAIALLVPKMASIDWRLTLLAFMSMPLVVVATNYFSKKIHDRFEQVQTYFGTVSNRAQESLAGVASFALTLRSAPNRRASRR